MFLCISLEALNPPTISTCSCGLGFDIIDATTGDVLLALIGADVCTGERGGTPGEVDGTPGERHGTPGERGGTTGGPDEGIVSATMGDFLLALVGADALADEAYCQCCHGFMGCRV